MSESPHELASRLHALLTRELEAYGEVLDLCRRQQALIEAKDANGLMTLLAEKQRRIEAITALEAEAKPLRETWDREHDGWPAAVREPVEACVARLRETLAAIVALEDEAKQEVETGQGAASDKLKQIQKGKLMHKAYGAPKVKPQARFQDRNG